MLIIPIMSPPFHFLILSPPPPPILRGWTAGYGADSHKGLSIESLPSCHRLPSSEPDQYASDGTLSYSLTASCKCISRSTPNPTFSSSSSKKPLNLKQPPPPPPSLSLLTPPLLPITLSQRKVMSLIPKLSHGTVSSFH